jgi:hypothetical protein
VSDERKYQVFVSSTFTDLHEARQELMVALLEQGLIPTGMELHPGEGNKRWSVIQRIINECDYYLILLGGRYGTLSPIGLSHVHREFVHATTKRKPAIALLHDQPDQLPEDQRETQSSGQAKFRDFRQLLQDQASCYYWSSPADLEGVIKRAVPEFIAQNPVPGWVPAGQVTDLGARREVQELQQRVDELEQEKEDLAAGASSARQAWAGDDDPVTLEYSCNAYVKGNCKAVPAESTLTWRQVFAAVAPQMLQPASETAMRQALEEHLSGAALTDVQKHLPKAHAVRNVTLTTASFNQVKVQLRAQGLIRKQSAADGSIRWQLTPLGDQTMTRLVAVPRNP